MINVSNKQRMFIEVNEILKHMDLELKNKIPFKIVKTFEMLSVGDYSFAYDKTKSLNEQKISEDTKDMISYLYIKYCCNEQKKKDLYEIIKANKEKEIKLDREKNWLLNRKYEESENELKEIEEKNNVIETALVKVDKENIFSKILTKIKKLFFNK